MSSLIIYQYVRNGADLMTLKEILVNKAREILLRNQYVVGFQK